MHTSSLKAQHWPVLHWPWLKQAEVTEGTWGGTKLHFPYPKTAFAEHIQLLLNEALSWLEMQVQFALAAAKLGWALRVPYEEFKFSSSVRAGVILEEPTISHSLVELWESEKHWSRAQMWAQLEMQCCLRWDSLTLCQLFKAVYLKGKQGKPKVAEDTDCFVGCLSMVLQPDLILLSLLFPTKMHQSFGDSCKYHFPFLTCSFKPMLQPGVRPSCSHTAVSLKSYKTPLWYQFADPPQRESAVSCSCPARATTFICAVSLTQQQGSCRWLLNPC